MSVHSERVHTPKTAARSYFYSIQFDFFSLSLSLSQSLAAIYIESTIFGDLFVRQSFVFFHAPSMCVHVFLVFDRKLRYPSNTSEIPKCLDKFRHYGDTWTLIIAHDYNSLMAIWKFNGILRADKSEGERKGKKTATRLLHINYVKIPFDYRLTSLNISFIGWSGTERAKKMNETRAEINFDRNFFPIASSFRN